MARRAVFLVAVFAALLLPNVASAHPEWAQRMSTGEVWYKRHVDSARVGALVRPVWRYLFDWVAQQHAEAMVDTGYFGPRMGAFGPPFLVWAAPHAGPNRWIGEIRSYRCRNNMFTAYAAIRRAMGNPSAATVLYHPQMTHIGIYGVKFHSHAGIWGRRNAGLPDSQQICRMFVSFWSG